MPLSSKFGWHLPDNLTLLHQGRRNALKRCPKGPDLKLPRYPEKARPPRPPIHRVR